MNEHLPDDIALLKQRLAEQEALNRLLQARLDEREREVAAPAAPDPHAQIVPWIPPARLKPPEAG